MKIILMLTADPQLQAKEEADRKAKEEADRKAKEERDRKAKEEALGKARIVAELSTSTFFYMHMIVIIIFTRDNCYYMLSSFYSY